MSQGLVNLTLPAVLQEIEYVLEEYPEHPYQAAFLLPELHQRLVAHILSNVPNYYIVQGVQEPFDQSKYPSLPIQERLQMELVVRASILHVLRENADWLSCNLPRV